MLVCATLTCVISIWTERALLLERGLADLLALLTGIASITLAIETRITVRKHFFSVSL